MDKIGLNYNTEKEPVAISEYGRYIQELIQKLPEIEDRKVRTEAAKYIVGVMAQMTPQAKDSADFQHKLWDLLFIIAGCNLDIDSPYAPPVISSKSKPRHIEYQNHRIKYGHYGHYLSLMIEAGSKEENPEVREAVAYSIAVQMKRDYLDWNKNVVNDQVIIDDLKRMSDGRLSLPDDTKLNLTGEQPLKKGQNQAKQQQQQPKKKKKKVPNLKANMNNPNNPAYKLRMQELGKM